MKQAANIGVTKKWSQGVMTSVGEFLTFDDANLGHMACLRNWCNDGPWLFTLHPDGNWVSLRRASEKDCVALGVPHWMDEGDYDPFEGE